MTNEVGNISGELELITLPTEVGTLVLATYREALDVYTVSGSPVASRPSHADVLAALQAAPEGERDVTGMSGAAGRRLGDHLGN